jgi:uncharacterized membrane protein YdjX (TVP38/TMEM64 family)
MQRKEWKAAAFACINPIFPFGPSSYYFGLTQIRFSRYIVTTMEALVTHAASDARVQGLRLIDTLVAF